MTPLSSKDFGFAAVMLDYLLGSNYFSANPDAVYLYLYQRLNAASQSFSQVYRLRVVDLSLYD